MPQRNEVMRRMVAVFGILLAAPPAGPVALAQLPASGQAQSPREVAQIRAAMTRFLEALNGLDLDGMTALFADDVTAFVPTAQPDRVNGKTAVAQIFRAYVDRVRAGGPAGRIEASDLTVEASGSLGIVTFNARAAGSATVRRRTFVFRRSGDVWLISHFHASDFTPQ